MIGRLDCYANVSSKDRLKSHVDRQKALVEYIFACALPPNTGDEYLILDPFVEFDEKVISALNGGKEEREENAYIWFLLQLGMLGEVIKVRLLSKKLPSRSLVRLDHKNIFLIPIESIDGRMEVHASYYSERQLDESYSKLPRKLHDRWILRITGDTVSGLHLGGSLTDIFSKDITITCFDDKTVKDAKQRFEDIWRYVSNE